MKTSSKTYLIIGSTFVLGLIAGVLLAPMILRGRPPGHKRWNSPEGFVKRYEEIIKPSDEQREKIRAILERHSRKFMIERQQLMDNVRADMDSLKLQLEPILTDEQKRQFEKRFRRHKQRLKRKKD